MFINIYLFIFFKLIKSACDNKGRWCFSTSFLQAYIKQANKFIRGFGCCDNHIVSIRGVNMFGYIQLTREERQYNKYFMSRI